MKGQKSTGWKLPVLISCGVAGGAILIGALIKPVSFEEHLPKSLLRKAEALRIDLDSEQNRLWKEDILAASSGFQSQAIKDAKLEMIIMEAASKKNLEVAFGALVQVRNRNLRSKLAANLSKIALEDCSILPWAVFSLRIFENNQDKIELQNILINKYEICNDK